MGPPELLGGFARENGGTHPLAHAFPQVIIIRHRIVPRKPPRSSGVTSNLGPFFCKRAQMMGRRGSASQTAKSERRIKHGRILRLCPRRKPAEPSAPPAPNADRFIAAFVLERPASAGPRPRTATRHADRPAPWRPTGTDRRPRTAPASQAHRASPAPGDDLLRCQPIAPLCPRSPPARPPCLLAAITCFLVYQ